MSIPVERLLEHYKHYLAHDEPRRAGDDEEVGRYAMREFDRKAKMIVYCAHSRYTAAVFSIKAEAMAR